MTQAWPITPERLAELMRDLRPAASAQSRVPRNGPDPSHVAAYLLRSLAKNHCYEDGNKRIAWAALLEVLWVNAALAIQADQDEAAELVIRVATSECGVDDLIEWLAAHIVAA